MRLKNYFFGLAGLVLCTAIGYIAYEDYNKPSYQEANYSSLLNAVGRADYGAQYYHMLRANADGEIPFEDVLRARREVAQSVSSGEKNFVDAIYWNYIGPDFVGGRTRGLWQDNKTPNSSKWYAGSVTGGIFISYNGGELWYDYNSNITSLSISSITQTSNGVLFVGTGSSHEGVSGDPDRTGKPGDGLFRREEDGNGGHTFTRIIGPEKANSSSSDAWRNINKVLGHPSDPNKLYVGMNRGLLVTANAQDNSESIEFINPIPAGNQFFTGDIDDLAINNAGTRLYMTSGAKLYILNDNGGKNIAVEKTETFAGGSRMCVSVAPSNDSIIYISASNSGSCLNGIYQSRDAGLTWKQIGTKSASFDPFENPGTNCQGNYDQTIAVYPSDAGRIIVGGVHLWKWQESSSNSGFGSWSQIAVTQGGGLTDTNYVHADKHRIKITPDNVVYIATDGGIHKSIDGGKTWGQNNNGFNVTQFYTMDAAVGVQINTTNNGSYILQQVMGGTQDNGTQLIGINPQRPTTAIEVTGGDGFACAFSSLGNLAFTTVYNGSLIRSSQGLGGGQFFFDAELALRPCPGPTSGGATCGPFYTRMAYWETAYADKTYDSILYKIQADTTYNVGDTIFYVSNTGAIPMAWAVDKTVSKGDSFYVPDFTQSKLVFYPGGSQLYMTREAPKLNQLGTDWSRIADNTSYPDAFSGSPFSFAFSKDGNQLFVGTEQGKVFRIDNLNEAYNDLTMDVRSLGCVLTCTEIGTGLGFVTSLALDPNNPDKLVATTGGYGGTIYVRMATTAATTTGLSNWTSIQGDLPKMPVYASVVHDASSSTILVGAEFGVWGTDNGGINWTKSEGLPLVPVYTLKQQSDEYIWGDNGPKSNALINHHYRKVFAGTDGRGFWVTESLVGIDDGDFEPIADKKDDQIQFSVYPNPMNSVGTMSLKSSKEQNAVIEVFDLNGKVVATVFNGTLKAGNQKMVFNVSSLKNGTYIARLRTTEEMQVSKFVVLK